MLREPNIFSLHPSWVLPGRVLGSKETPGAAVRLTRPSGAGRGQKVERSFIQFVTHLSAGHWPKGREEYTAVDGAAREGAAAGQVTGDGCGGTLHQGVWRPEYKPLTHPFPVPHW